MGRTRSRRKSGTLSSHGQQNSTSPGSASSSSDSANASTNERRVLTPVEAALTAKNYRLAKELNELRSRHRDETKNVAKLTMENMNLKTQCKRAKNHADTLKKELNFHQKRNLGFIASGKTQACSDSGEPTNLSLSGKDFSEKNNSLFHNTSFHQRQLAQDHLIDKASVETKSERNNNDSLLNPLDENIFGGVDACTDDILLDSPHLEHSPVLSPSINETPNNGPDAAFGELQSTVFFQNSYKNTLPATPESEYVKRDDGLFHSDTENLVGNVSEGGSVGEDSSIDAFEASFSTTFPTSFKPTVLEYSLPPSEPSSGSSSGSGSGTGEFSDPFFPDTSGSRKDGKRRSRRKSEDGKKVVRRKSPPSSPRHQLQPRNGRLNSKSKTLHKRIECGKTINTKSKADKIIDLFPESAMKSFEEMSVSTPPAKTKPLDENGDAFHNPPPPPSEKSGMCAARARYDAAYGENKEDILQSITPGCESSEHSPTLVLKRLQQRKAKEKISSTPVDVPSNPEVISRSISEEIQKLDKIANRSSVCDPPLPPPGQPPISKRRTVRQPVSYTEPSLTTKLRQGDVFFPKEDVSTRDVIPIHDQPTQQLSV